MTKHHAFKIRKNADSEPVEFKIELPVSMDDIEWIDLRYGNVERMIDRANAQLVVDVAPGMRKRLPDVKAAQFYADEYCDNGSRDAYQAPKIDAAEAEGMFDKGQLEFLRSKGMIA